MHLDYRFVVVMMWRALGVMVLSFLWSLPLAAQTCSQADSECASKLLTNPVVGSPQGASSSSKLLTNTIVGFDSFGSAKLLTNVIINLPSRSVRSPKLLLDLSLD
jgi:hypothetical protein